MEEPVLGGEPLDFGSAVSPRHRSPAVSRVDESGAVMASGASGVLRPDERGAPRVGRQPLARGTSGDVGVGPQPLLLNVDVGQRQAGCRPGPAACSRQLGVRRAAIVDVEQSCPARAALGLVALGQRGGDLLVVALDRLERLVGDALGEQRRGGAEQGVADLDVGVEERQRLAGLQRLQPQRRPWPVRRPSG